MEVELVTEETSEDENYGLDDNSEDYLNFEGERCGICMDVVIDRGVLDCCHHWFCFACIDNWATITSLCPLCQNEFQLITCVPVYDTVGGNKTDDDINPRDDDWSVEGKNNTLSFPSYYIDENAVVCLDGDGCKIRSGSVAIEGDPDIDTSIACDSCDKWYHAFCVGFDPEGTCDSSWLCPRCTIDKGPQKLDRVSISRKNHQSGLEFAGDDSPADASFSGRVSVSVADDGETAVVISLIDGNQETHESGESVLGYSKDMENTLLSSSISDMPKSEVLPGDGNRVELKACQQEMEISLSRDNCCSSSHSKSPARLNDDAVHRTPRYVNNKTVDSGLDLGLLMGSVDMEDNDRAEGHVPGPVDQTSKPVDPLPAESMVPNEMEALSLKIMIPKEKETKTGISGSKRKHKDSRRADDGERAANADAKISRRKIKAERNSQVISLRDQTAVSDLDESSSISSRSSLRDSTVKCKSEKENGTSDIMDIVQGTDRRSLKQLGHKSYSNKAAKERENNAGLRLKKIMRRPGDDKDSLVLVQELRKKIREAVRNKSSEEIGQKLFDPTLLDAFRAALAGSGAENRKPTLDVKAKRSLLQKGKVRESLTKKIYGTGGKRRRAWTRECEVEFWRHRCIKTSKPEKIQTLKSVLDLLRDKSDYSKKMPGNEEEAKGSILSRLYLADTSVFPRKNDIEPVSVLKAVEAPEEKRESGLTEKVSTALPIDQSVRIPQKQNGLSQASVPPLDDNETKNSVKGMKAETASFDAHQRKYPAGAPSPALGSMKTPSEKDVASKSDINVASKSDIKGDKRKWALEVLARKTVASGKNTQVKEDSMILKGNYTLLAQLPKEMRPVLAPSRHNKIPTPVRQAQLYRLTEHFLKKANLSVVCRTAEIELAVADAVNIEKQVADRSNSKLVYLNLCSQELLRRSDDVNSDRANESRPCSTSECLSDGTLEETNNSSLDLEVDEALKKAGLMSDSPPSSPNNPKEDNDNRVGSPEKNDEEGPDNVIEVDSHPELDIYGDFEYNLEDDDFIGAGALNVSKLQPEPPKLKLLFSSLKPEEPDGNLDLPDHKAPTDVEASACTSGLLNSEDKTTGCSTVDSGNHECLVQNSSVDDDEECEELYGPDKEPLIQKYPEAVSMTPFEQNFNSELHGQNGDDKSNYTEKNSGQSSEDNMEKLEVSAADGSKQSPSNVQEKENVIKKEKTTKCDTKQPDTNSMIMKKVEAYIKEHIRPLCKSGVITVEQYRWAVGKTTEKVMRYHSKEKNANFLIKEGEKVKKLAEQYVETAQQKAKT